MLDLLAEKADERKDKYKVSVIDTWPRLTLIDAQTYLGSFSWTMPYKHERLIYGPTAVYLFGPPQTPGEIVRDYLDIKFPKRLRCTTPQYQAIMAPRSFPRMAIRGEHGEGVYLDLKSAYWSIVQAVGWDVDYFPGKWLGVQSDVRDFPLQLNKAARSAMVTAGLSSPVRLWKNKTLSWRSTQNRHINFGLWAVVQDVLHGVADDMKKAGAVYVHTDGYILPADRVGEGIEIARSWGFNFSVKATGHVMVFGVGVYLVGTKRTKRQVALPVEDHVHIEPHQKDWLRSKFRFWSDRVH